MPLSKAKKLIKNKANGKRMVSSIHQNILPDILKHVPEELWGDDDAFVACQLNSYKVTDVDFMKLSGDKYFGWPDPVLEGIENADDLFKFKSIGADHPWIRGQVERTKKVIKGLNGECVALYLIFAPLSYLRLQVGYPKMMELIRQNPEAMKHALSVIAEDVKVLVKGIIEEAGADGISLINTLLGMRIDIRTKRPILHNNVGGFSGPAIFPVAVRMVYQVSHAVNIPVVGMGGVASAEDVIEMMMAGACAVEVGAQNLVDPYACKRIIEDLPRVMDEYKIENLKDIIGVIE